jgi:hypothetical protein
MGKRTRRPARKSGWRQWKANEARRVVEAWRASGLPLAAFAHQRGLTPERLRWWRQRLGDWNAGGAAPSLVPAVVTGERTAATATVTVRVGIVVVEVADVDAVPAPWLAALVSGLAKPAA